MRLATIHHACGGLIAEIRPVETGGLTFQWATVHPLADACPGCGESVEAIVMASARINGRWTRAPWLRAPNPDIRVIDTST